MAVPLYDHDLVDISLAESATGYSAINYSGGGGGAPAFGPDLAMQGVNCVDRPVSAAERAIAFDDGATLAASVAAGVHIFQWMFTATPGITDILATRGVYVLAGTALTATVQLHVDGSDTFGASGRVGKCYPYRYKNTANTAIPYRTLDGAPGATPQFFGAGLKTVSSAKGSNLGVDAVRYGTGAYITAGEVANPATFTDFAVQNDRNDASPNDNRWGILSKIGTAFELQGRFVVGQTKAQVVTLAYFDDSDVTINIVDTPHCESDFTQIIIDHASSTFIITNVNIEAIGTINKGRFIVTSANPTVTITGGLWTAIGFTVFRSNTTATGLTFRKAEVIQSNGSDLIDCIFDKNLGIGLSSYALQGTLAYSGFTKDTTTQDSSLSNITFNDDGTKFFMLGAATRSLYEYTLATAYDFNSTLTYTTNSYSFSAVDADPRALVFNLDGTKMFMLGALTQDIHEYTLSVGFDLSSTITKTGNIYDVGTQETAPKALKFNNDGTKFFIVGFTTDTLYEYTLSIAFDLGSTKTYTGNSKLLTTGPTGFEFSPDGTSVLVCDSLAQEVSSYPLSTGFDVSTMGDRIDRVIDISANLTTVYGIHVGHVDGEARMFLGDNSGADTYQYDMEHIAGTAVVVDDLSELSNATFTQAESTNGHAVILRTLGTGIMSWDSSATGFAATDGDTGDEIIFVEVSTGTLTINAAAGATVPTIKTNGATVSVVVAQIDFSFTVNPSITGYEWRLYEKDVTEGTIGTVELGGEETATVDNQTYSYTYVADKDVVLQIIADGYEEKLTEITLKSTNQDITVNIDVEENT